MCRPRPPHHPFITIAILTLAITSCEFLDHMDQYFAPPDDLTPVEHTATAAALARESILSARPQSSALYLDQLAFLLPGTNIVALVAGHSATAPGEIPQDCPFLSAPSDGLAVPCARLLTAATQASRFASSNLASSVMSQTLGSRSVTPGERAFVGAWAQEAVLSGLVTSTIQSLDVMRAVDLCDDTNTPAKQAAELGQRQGRVIFRNTYDAMRPDLPRSQCNTDILATTILAEARKRAADFNAGTSICLGVDPSHFAQSVDLLEMENLRIAAVDEGLEQEFELLRVELVEKWTCDPETTYDPSDPCQCYARYSGRGPVFCYLQSQYRAELNIDTPFSGTQLQRMSDRGVPQCAGDNSNAQPIGSPLVFDLDHDGIHLSSRATTPFDLANTGEIVRFSALTGRDALLVLDLDGNGRIDSGAELFGNHTWCGQRRCADGVEAIQHYDSDGNGRIDANDPVFSQLRLWHDANHDGVAQPGELSTLRQEGIAYIDLSPRMDLAWTDRLGNSAVRAITFVRDDQRQGEVHDVWFALTFDDFPVDVRSSGISSRLAQALR